LLTTNTTFPVKLQQKFKNIYNFINFKTIKIDLDKDHDKEKEELIK
jgi:hypothetical protein